MAHTDPVQCASCGWTGHADDLDAPASAASCPVCGEGLRSGD